jgi:hypothetical protein
VTDKGIHKSEKELLKQFLKIAITTRTAFAPLTIDPSFIMLYKRKL